LGIEITGSAARSSALLAGRHTGKPEADSPHWLPSLFPARDGTQRGGSLPPGAMRGDNRTKLADAGDRLLASTRRPRCSRRPFSIWRPHAWRSGVLPCSATLNASCARTRRRA